jgi:hypothetical protein
LSLASVLVTVKAKLVVAAETGGEREQLIRLSENDLQAHLGKRARVGKMLPLKPKSSVVSVKLWS